jgi:hypothetical protein
VLPHLSGSKRIPIHSAERKNLPCPDQIFCSYHSLLRLARASLHKHRCLSSFNTPLFPRHLISRLFQTVSEATVFKMLEAEMKNEKSNPNETALAMLTFIQGDLFAGSAASEARFFNNLFPLLCERIFGPILGPDDDFRHKAGGWLAAQKRWGPSETAFNTKSPTSPNTGRSKFSQTNDNALENDHVVKLLATCGPPNMKNELPPPTLIEALSFETKNRPNVAFSFPFHALPRPTQEVWSLVQSATSSTGGPFEPQITAQDISGTENTKRLVLMLLRFRPMEQESLIKYQLRQSRKQLSTAQHTMQVSPRNYMSPRNLSPSSSSNNDEPPTITLGMLEYYLFVFLRFPLAAPKPSSASGAPISGGQVSPFGDKVYLHLFGRYMRHFLPYQREGNRCIHWDNQSTESELFFRVLVTLWLELQSCVRPTDVIVSALQERCKRSGASLSLDLNSSYNLVEARYDPPVPLVKLCVFRLVEHLISDPTLQGTVTEKSPQWCLPPAMTALQQAFYNYVRTALRYASVHNSQSFHDALKLWLMWIEPWNLIQRKYERQLTDEYIRNVHLTHSVLVFHTYQPNSIIRLSTR